MSEELVVSSDVHAIAIVVDGQPIAGRDHQTLAAVMLAAGRTSWRRTTREGRPRGLFCGIGVCFDCVVTLNGVRDVRACLRRASDGDVVEVQS